MGSYGSDFYIGAVQFVYIPRPLRLYVTTLSSSTVQFTVETGTGFVINSTVVNSNATIVDLPFAHAVVKNSSYSNRNKGIHVYSRTDGGLISVLVITNNHNIELSAEYLAYPYKVYQTNQYIYYINAPNTTYDNYVILVGTEDNTAITIVATEQIRDAPQNVQSSVGGTYTHSAGVPYSFTLHKLQTLLLFIANTDVPYFSMFDISGTKIVSNKPLTVLNSYYSIACCCQVYMEQTPPTLTWGKKFLLVPYLAHVIDLITYYKVLAAESQTTVQYTCGSSGTPTTYTLNSGGFATIYSDNSYCSIISDKPVSVAQLQISLNLEYYGKPYYSFWYLNRGDEVGTKISSIDQYSLETSFIALNNDPIYSYYINIALTTIDTILLDGQPLSLNWTQIFDGNHNVIGYGTRYTALTSATTISHTITTQSNTSFSLIVYGLPADSCNGYSYSAGINLKAQNITTSEGNYK